MTYPCTLKYLIDGQWQARSLGTDVGNVEVIAASRRQAVERLRDEIRYRLEWCPCSAVDDDYVQLEIRESVRTPWRGTVF